MITTIALTITTDNTCSSTPPASLITRFRTRSSSKGRRGLLRAALRSSFQLLIFTSGLLEREMLILSAYLSVFLSFRTLFSFSIHASLSPPTASPQGNLGNILVCPVTSSCRFLFLCLSLSPGPLLLARILIKQRFRFALP